MLELLALALGTIISEEVACITAGLLIASGRQSFAAATMACIAGIYAGDLLYYGLGRMIGTPLLARAASRWAEPVQRGKEWFERNGTTAVFTARFLPGTRVPAYMAAGAMGMSFVRFSVFFLIAAFVWTPILVGLSAVLGDSLRAYGWKMQLGAALLMLIAMRSITLIKDTEGRKRLVERWRRLTRWARKPAPDLAQEPDLAHRNESAADTRRAVGE
jgi:membrane protein DedA with SNARE-associated domain